MVFNDRMIIWILWILILGFCVLTYIVWKLQAHYNRLTHGVKDATLSHVLNELLEELRTLKTRTTQVEKTAGKLEIEGRGHIQRIGIVRFNPFSDTGGAQSFTIAILDGNHDGMVMTSLYARMGNRWYIKQIFGGKGRDIELSKEESSAIAQAIGEK